jgi:Zn-dependent M28 family amino/carboxypeptidase
VTLRAGKRQTTCQGQQVTDSAVGRDRLRAHVRALAGEIGERNVFRPRALRDARDFIEHEWRAQGYRVTPQAYETHGLACANLEVTRSGTDRPDEIVLVGAHYDSVFGSPGANDNGSGVAALLEMSRRFAEAEPRRTVRFVAFVNEEPPFSFTSHMGSEVYARAARARGEDIRLMLSLETIGYYSEAPGSQHYPPFFNLFYPGRGNFIAFISNFRSRRLLRRVVDAFQAHSDFPVQSMATLALIPGVSWSDHRAFWRQGYSALMATDTAFYRYPYYHSALDTPEKLNYDALGRLADALFHAVAALADEE